MPFKGNDFQHTRTEGYNALLGGRYGEEHDDRLGELVDVENGVRKYWADQLRAQHERDHHMGMPCKPEYRCGARELLDLLDPYSGKDGADGEFARTALTGEDGYKWITPDAED